MPLDEFLEKVGGDQVKTVLDDVRTQLDEKEWNYRYIFYSGGWVNRVAATSFRIGDGHLHYLRLVFSIKDDGRAHLERKYRGIIPLSDGNTDWHSIGQLGKKLNERFFASMNLEFRLIQRRSKNMIESIVLPIDTAPKSEAAWNECFVQMMAREIIRDVQAGNATTLRVRSK